MADIDIDISEVVEITEWPYLNPDNFSVFSDGYVLLTNNSNQVTGHQTGFNNLITAGDLFQVLGSDEFYKIYGINSNRQLKLNSNYVGTTKADVPYIIHTDETSKYKFPRIKSTDGNWYALWNHALRMIDSQIQSVYDWFNACRVTYKIDIVDITESFRLVTGQLLSVYDIVEITTYIKRFGLGDLVDYDLIDISESIKFFMPTDAQFSDTIDIVDNVEVSMGYLVGDIIDITESINIVTSYSLFDKLLILESVNLYLEDV